MPGPDTIGCGHCDCANGYQTSEEDVTNSPVARPTESAAALGVRGDDPVVAPYLQWQHSHPKSFRSSSANRNIAASSASPSRPIFHSTKTIRYATHAHNNKGIFLKYHDPSKCVDIRVIDRFGLLALNALAFRVVYLAKDSGETIDFGFLFKKTDDGSWLLGQAPKKVN